MDLEYKEDNMCLLQAARAMQAGGELDKEASSDIKKVQLGSSGNAPFKNKNLAEALHMQMEVQTQLHEQL